MPARVPPPLALLKALIGPGVVFVGYTAMFSSYWTGASWAYVGIAICLAEGIYEPRLRRLDYRIQTAMICVVVVFAALFTIKIVGAKSPIDALAHMGAPAEYPPNAQIAGIEWNPKFADVRVALNDPISDDYSNVNLVVRPNSWVYKAAIVDQGTGCSLLEEPGQKIFAATAIKSSEKDAITADNTFGKLSVRDSDANVFNALASDSGYRLTCSFFPSHSSIEIVFAAVATNNDLLKSMPPPKLKRGEWGFSVGEFKPENKNDTVLDFWGPKPQPSAVRLAGTYRNGSRTYSIDKTVKINY